MVFILSVSERRRITYNTAYLSCIYMENITINGKIYQVDFKIYKDFSPDICHWSKEEIREHFIVYGHAENRIYNLENLIDTHPLLSFFSIHDYKKYNPDIVFASDYEYVSDYLKNRSSENRIISTKLSRPNNLKEYKILKSESVVLLKKSSTQEVLLREREKQIESLHFRVADLSASVSNLQDEILRLQSQLPFVIFNLSTRIAWAVLHPLKFIRKHVWDYLYFYNQIPFLIHNSLEFLLRKLHLQKFFQRKSNQEYIDAVLNMKFSDVQPIRFKKYEKPKVSIIIPVYNKWQFTYHCLHAIEKNTSDILFEVIVVDNASVDETSTLLSGIEHITYIRNAENLGFAKACNLGALSAQGEFIVFLNNDTIPLHRWLSSLVHELDANPRFGIVGSRLAYPDNTIQHAGVFFNENGYSYHIHRGTAYVDEKKVNVQKTFLAVTGACLAIRKTLFEAVSGFDENYRSGYEDIDLCLKVGLLGYAVVYCPSSSLYHYESMTEGRYDHNVHNTAVFDAKWNGPNIFQSSIELENIHAVTSGAKLALPNTQFLLKPANSQPLVTIVTVTFNPLADAREFYLRQCIESVHAQSYKNIEHLIVDGGSTDGTVDVLNEYAEKGWIRYISESDTGIYDAMNKGIQLAQGSYVAFLNSDDYYHNPLAVELSVEALEKNGADFSYGAALYVDTNGKVVDQNHPHHAPDISTVFHCMPFCHQTMFTRRTVFLDGNMFDTSYKIAGDYDLLIRMCLQNYESVFVAHSLVTFRYGGISDLIGGAEKIKDEVARSYFTNYRKLADITMEEARTIYRTNTSGIPLNLANELKRYGKYFILK